MSIELRPVFDVAPNVFSARLFFVKQSRLEPRWHIVDAALYIGEDSKNTPIFVALHGKPIVAVVRADTVLQLEISANVGDGLCEQCLAEFALAADIIQQRQMLRFE